MSVLKLTQIGNSVGVILPKEGLAKMNVGKDDTLYLSKAASDEVLLSPYDDAFTHQMEVAQRVQATVRLAQWQ